MRVIFFASLLAMLSPSHAVLPESGVYWNPLEPGRGYVIEHQNGMVFVLIFAYDHDSGAPRWYTAQGPLVEGDGWDEPPPGLFGEGFYPAHEMRGRLAEVTGGACLYCLHRDPETVREIADLALYFDYMKNPRLEIVPDEPLGSSLALDPPVRVLERFDFARQPFGHEDSAFHHLRTPDLSGDWLFSDRADPAAAPWRLVLSFDGFESLFEGARAYAVRFVDEARNAEVTCKVGNNLLHPPAVPGLGFIPGDGCEFAFDGHVEFSAQQFDIGPSRIEAFRGTLPHSSGGPMRREQRITGVRVE